MEIQTVTIKSEKSEDDYYPEENLQISLKTNIGKPFTCGVCGHRTTSDILLKVHLKMHLLQRVHQCQICKKCFSFVTELNNHMVLHDQERCYHSVLRDNFSEETHKEKVQQVKSKQFINKNPNLPLNEKEKFLLVEHIDKLGLNVKYKEMEQIKTFLRNGWTKIADIFAENNYDRNPDKLARTYFHMKNQAKMHIERFYVHKKLPRPRKMDYMFVKLCTSDFEGLGLDMRELQDDSKIFDQESLAKEESVDEDEKSIEDIELPNESLEEIEQGLSVSETSTSQKRAHSEETDVPPHKIVKTEGDEIKSLKIKFLLQEEKRREKEHNLEVKKKDMEIQHYEELHRKNLLIKDMELALLTQKIQEQGVQLNI